MFANAQELKDWLDSIHKMGKKLNTFNLTYNTDGFIELEGKGTSREVFMFDVREYEDETPDNVVPMFEEND